MHTLYNAEFSDGDIEEAMEEWIAVDNLLTITMTSHVMRRASFVQGSGMLRAFTASFPSLNHILKAMKRRLMKESVIRGTECGHHITIFGAVCGLLNISSVNEVIEMLIYTTIRDMVSAAVRLNLVGPLEGGYYISQLCDKGVKLSSQIIADSGADINKLSNAHQVAPLVEVVSECIIASSICLRILVPMLTTSFNFIQRWQMRMIGFTHDCLTRDKLI